MSIQSATNVDAMPSSANAAGRAKEATMASRRVLQQRPERHAGEDVEEHEEQIADDGADGQVRVEGAARGRRHGEALRR